MYHGAYPYFLGERRMPERREWKYLGQSNINYQGSLMTVVKYNNSRDMFVEFNDPVKCIVHTRATRFNSGHVKNPYYPSIYGICAIGQKYKICDKSGKFYKEYCLWSNMIKRCFSENTKKKQPMYHDVTCCEEWKVYENFVDWIYSQKNYETLKQTTNFALDKDILQKGNKIYAPDRCSLVTQRINNLLIKSDSKRGECVIGVFYDWRRMGYVAQCNDIENGHQYLGKYETEAEAFNAYKNYKEALIRRVAEDEYNKGLITYKCYKALINYEVEITD